MTQKIKPLIVVSVTKKTNGRLVLNYTRPEKPSVNEKSGAKPPG